jgi:hypothetical protein
MALDRASWQGLAAGLFQTLEFVSFCCLVLSCLCVVLCRVVLHACQSVCEFLLEVQHLPRYSKHLSSEVRSKMVTKTSGSVCQSLDTVRSIPA